MRIQDPGWKKFGPGNWDGKKSDPGSRINILDPQHWFDWIRIGPGYSWVTYWHLSWRQMTHIKGKWRNFHDLKSWMFSWREEKIFFNFFLLLQTPLRLITLSAYIWSTFSCSLLLKAAGPASFPKFPLAGKSCKFYVTFFEPRKILCCLVLESVSRDWFLAIASNYRLTLFRRTFRLISCRNKKIGEEEKSIFRCFL